MLEIGGIPFSNTFCATGARGFYGEGYPFHKYLKYVPGFTWGDTSFSGKTLTLLPRKGNMPLKEDGVTPEEFTPKCIYVEPIKGEIINAVGLSNFGAEFYLRNGKYHDIEDPFFISIMLMAPDKSGREAEIREFCMLLQRYLPFKKGFGLQINFGCPNTGHDISHFRDEMISIIEIAKETLPQVPIVPNVNALMPTEILMDAVKVADALWIGNTIPFGSTETTINWSRFGDTSPLQKRGFEQAGGLSSPECLIYTIRKISELRDNGVKCPIIGGNGIRKISDVDRLKKCGANGIFLGSIVLARPRRMRTIINYSNQIFSQQ